MTTNQKWVERLLGSLVALVIALILSLILPRRADCIEVIKYTDQDGTVSYTDTMKRVPKQYREVTSIVNTDEIKSKITISDPSKEQIQVWQDFEPVTTMPERTDPHWVMNRVRRQYGDYNRSVLILEKDGVEVLTVIDR